MKPRISFHTSIPKPIYSKFPTFHRSRVEDTRLKSPSRHDLEHRVKRVLKYAPRDSWEYNFAFSLLNFKRLSGKQEALLNKYYDKYQSNAEDYRTQLYEKYDFNQPKETSPDEPEFIVERGDSRGNNVRRNPKWKGKN